MLQDYIKSRIKKKLNNYSVALNNPDTSLPLELNRTKRVTVVGGGIAGISAAANLSERGFQVDLYEKSNYLGGKLGSWQFESNGSTLSVEHGFHAFFKQYFNLLEFMKKIDAYKHLIPIDDYLIFYPDRTTQSFKNMDTTPLLNVWSMGRTGVFRYRDMMLNRYGTKLLDLFKFDFEKTFEQYDDVPLSDFMRDTHIPEKMKMVFSSFARAFFSEPEDMSTAELIKSFHFYFLSNDLGLLYDVLDDDFEQTFLLPVRTFLEKHQTKILLNTPVEKVNYNGGKFYIEGKEYDYCILALDVKHLPILIDNSPSLSQFSKFYKQAVHVKTSARYAVYRVWTDSFEDMDYPFFVFTDRLKCLDSITFYHKMEKESRAWSDKNNGGIFELHCYALPKDLSEDHEIKKQLLAELFHYLPELKQMKIRHEYFQHREDFSAFHTGLYKNRPGIKTELPNLFLAGDWVKMDNCTMLMEAAYTSGSIAANEIFIKEKLRENPLFSVPVKGLLA